MRKRRHQARLAKFLGRTPPPSTNTSTPSSRALGSSSNQQSQLRSTTSPKKYRSQTQPGGRVSSPNAMASRSQGGAQSSMRSENGFNNASGSGQGSMDHARSDVLHKDRDIRLRGRLGAAGEFKLSPLLQFWQGKASTSFPTGSDNGSSLGRRGSQAGSFSSLPQQGTPPPSSILDSEQDSMRDNSQTRDSRR